MNEQKITPEQEAIKVLESAIDISITRGVFKKEEVVVLVNCFIVLNNLIKQVLSAKEPIPQNND